jgi:hypothetical protein
MAVHSPIVYVSKRQEETYNLGRTRVRYVCSPTIGISALPSPSTADVRHRIKHRTNLYIHFIECSYCFNVQSVVLNEAPHLSPAFQLNAVVRLAQERGTYGWVRWVR